MNTNLLDAVIVQTIAKKYKKHLRKECFNYRQSLLYNKWEVEAEKDFGDIWYDDEVMKRTDMMVSIVMKMKQTAGMRVMTELVVKAVRTWDEL